MVRLFETLNGITKSASMALADGSKRDNAVLMVLLLAFWRWLLPAPAMQVPWPHVGTFLTALLAVQRRHRLAPIPVPLRRLLS
jgi:hypothetical protein